MTRSAIREPNAARTTAVPQSGREPAHVIARSLPGATLCIASIFCRGGSYGQEAETEIFAQRRHRSGARDAPLQARNSEERQGRQGEEPQAGDRHRALEGAQEGQESPEEKEIASNAVAQSLRDAAQSLDAL